MALPSSGPLSSSQISTELGTPSTNISLGGMSDTASFSAPDAMSDFYGYSAATLITASLRASNYMVYNPSNVYLNFDGAAVNASYASYNTYNTIVEANTSVSAGGYAFAYAGGNVSYQIYDNYGFSLSDSDPNGYASVSTNYTTPNLTEGQSFSFYAVGY